MNEIHGVRASKNHIAACVLLREHDTAVCIDLDGRSTVTLTAEEIRHLARKLHRLARRIELRAEGYEL